MSSGRPAAADAWPAPMADLDAAWLANTASLPVGGPAHPLHRWLIGLWLLLTGAMSAAFGVAGAAGWVLTGGWAEPATDAGLPASALLKFDGPESLAVALLGLCSAVAANRFLGGRSWREAAACLVLWAVAVAWQSRAALEGNTPAILLLVLAAGSVAHAGRSTGAFPEPAHG